MGVHGLLSLLKSEQLGEDVKLADIAADYRKKTGKRPVLLVDISSSLPFLHSPKSGLLIAELKKFKENCQEFLNKFYDLDIHLYIIENGTMSNIKIPSWIRSMDTAVQNSYLTHSMGDLTHVNDRGAFLYNTAIEDFSLSDKCEFHRSTYEAMNYIARYLKENEAFGVISHNSDVILMEGSHYFLSIEDLDLSEMTTFNFSKDKLAQYLNIKAHLLPHVGTLCPNTILDSHDLIKFLRKYCWKTNKVEKFKTVADIVRQYLSDLDQGNYSLKQLQDYKSVLCLDERKLEIYMKRLRILNGEPEEEPEVIENKRWNDILTMAKALHHKGRTVRCVLELLLGKKFFSGIGLENVMMRTPGEELQNLRRRIYGFLFFEYPGEASVTEHIYAFRNNKTAYFSCEVTFERRDHVGLLELWSADAPIDIQEKKYKYFFEIINNKLDPNILLGKVEQEFVFPLLATFYLRYELGKFNNPKLMDVFLIHSILANKLSATEVAEIDCEFDCDALNMCGWYLKVIDHLDLVNSVCGHPFDRSKTDIVNFFDGLVLQRVYRDINDGKGIPEEVFPTFKRLKKVLIEMKQCCGF